VSIQISTVSGSHEGLLISVLSGLARLESMASIAQGSNGLETQGNRISK